MNSEIVSTGLNEIGQIAIAVTNLEKATAFYRDVLGLKHLFCAPPGLSFFGCGNIRLMLSRPEKADSEQFSAAIYFKVGDITAAHKLLNGHGVNFEADPHMVSRMPDHELWLAFFRDPDLNLLALMCDKRN